MKLIAEKASTPEPINIGHDDEVSMRELVTRIIELTGRSASVVFDTSKPDGYPRRAADATRLRMLTGWVPDTPLERGLEEMIEEYRRMPEAAASVARSR
jgi:GDP-L-fucose synthase